MPSQILMPDAESGREEVEPEMSQRSSAMTARRKTRLVVRRGRIGSGGSSGLPEGEGREREKRRGGGAKRESVPVPVLLGERSDVSVMMCFAC